jgi:hypothetical protein
MQVSIITRTLAGRERLLRRALQSVASQHTTSSIEVVIAVDGAAPLDLPLVGIGEFPFARVVPVSPQETGRSAAANTGLALSRGKYVNFLDDDDWLLPNHVETLERALERDSTVAAAYAGALQYAIDVDPLAPRLPSSGDLPTHIYVPSVKSLDLLQSNPFPIQSLMFRASLLKKGCRFRTELDALEDWLFWQQLLVGERFHGSAEATSAFLVPSSPERRRVREKAHNDALPTMSALQQSLGIPIASVAALVPAEATGIATSQPPARSRLVQRLAGRKRELATKERAPTEAVEYLVLDVGQRLLQSWRKGRITVPKMSPREGRAELNRPLPARRQRLSELFDRPAGLASVSRGTVVFTSCNGGYLDKAVSLAKSVKRHHPEVQFHILLVDDAYDGLEERLAGVVDRIVLGSQLEVFRPGWAFAHNVEELCCAVKPFYFSHLLDAGCERVVFLDPDMLVCSPMNSVFEALGQSSVLLTPHLRRPASSPEAIEGFEISALAHGTFNLGFLAVRGSSEGNAVIRYWRDRLQSYCFGDIAHGLWTDQNWFNHVPVFFGDVQVSSNPGLNTAVWNMEGGLFGRDDETYTIDRRPIEVFHFSGWDKGIPRAWEKRLATTEGLKELFSTYQAALDTNAEYRQPGWLYAYYDNGEKITQAQRTCYRKNPDLQDAFPNPFLTGERSYYDWIYTVGEREIERQYDESTWVRRHF